MVCQAQRISPFLLSLFVITLAHIHFQNPNYFYSPDILEANAVLTR